MELQRLNRAVKMKTGSWDLNQFLDQLDFMKVLSVSYFIFKVQALTLAEETNSTQGLQICTIETWNLWACQTCVPNLGSFGEFEGVKMGLEVAKWSIFECAAIH